MFRLVLLTALLLTCYPDRSYAIATDCSNQTGELIFEDTFKDAGGDWHTAVGRSGDFSESGAAGLAMWALPGKPSSVIVNDKFSIADGDYCMVARGPGDLDSSMDPTRTTYLGLVFQYADNSNFALLKIGSDHSFDVWVDSQGQLTQLFHVVDRNKYYLSSGDTEIRVIVRGSAVVASINGTEHPKVTLPKPAAGSTAAGKFGIYVQVLHNVEQGFFISKLRISKAPKEKLSP